MIFKIPPLTSKFAYFLIVLAAFLAQFLLFPYGIFSDRPTYPGDGFAFLCLLIFYVILSVVFVIPLIIRSWYFGLRGKRYSVLFFLLGLLASEWLAVLFSASIIFGNLENMLSQQEDRELLSRASLISLTETVLTNGNSPIGVHFDLQADLPPEWGKKHTGCSDLIIRLPAKEHTDSMLSITTRIKHNICKLSRNKKTYQIHYQGDYYPAGVYFAKANKICTTPVYDQGFTKPFTGEVTIEDGSYEGLTIHYPNDPVPARLKTEIIDHIHLLKNPIFWHQAEQNLSADRIRAAGYSQCPRNDPFVPTETCFCR